MYILVFLYLNRKRSYLRFNVMHVLRVINMISDRLLIDDVKTYKCDFWFESVYRAYFTHIYQFYEDSCHIRTSVMRKIMKRTKNGDARIGLGP